jgi:hypothetical protein
MTATDANDLIYYVNASRNYDPSPHLDKITAPVLWINSADDFINPPELGIAEKQVKRMPHARFILIPISDATRGHGTHTVAAVWKDYLAHARSPENPSRRRLAPILKERGIPSRGSAYELSNWQGFAGLYGVKFLWPGSMRRRAQ